MANQPTRNHTPKMVEFTRHIPGPPRRSPGQRCFLSSAQIRSQKLKSGDFKVIKKVSRESQGKPASG